MKKLTDLQVRLLQDCKGDLNGRHKFYDLLLEFYADDAETTEKIQKFEEMLKGVESLVLWPNAQGKTEQMYREYLTPFLTEIGYYGAEVRKPNPDAE